MKNLKKLSALVLALVLVLAVTNVAWAADSITIESVDDEYSGSNDPNAIDLAGGTTIPLTKSIKFVNVNGSTVYEPNITYTYTVEPATIDECEVTVTDNNAVTAYVHPGVEDGVTGTTITFAASNDPVAASSAGTEVEHTGNLTIDLSKFSKPGIYRYKITESSDPENVTAAGLDAREEAYNTVRFLDVYIHYNDDKTLEMYGAVIFLSSEATVGEDNIDTTKVKTLGYGPADGGADQYTTYDIIVEKLTDGDMADPDHEFPFYVTVSNTISGAKFTYTSDGSETFTGATVSSGIVTLTATSFSVGSNSTSSTLKLKNGDTITFVGVPSNQTTDLAIVVKEFNDSVDSYTPSAIATQGTVTLESTAAMAALTGSVATESFDIKDNDVADQKITITNTLDEISPTGVVLRFAPYALILVAGAALLLISRKRKVSDEE